MSTSETVSAKLYSKLTCPFCHMAKNLLEQKNIAYIEIDVASDNALREELIAQTGHRTVPIVFINDEFVGGFDDLQVLNNSGKLDNMLNK